MKSSSLRAGLCSPLRPNGNCWRRLEKNPVLSRSVRLRNPYVDPLSLIQADLLRRKRTGLSDPGLDYALGATMNGIVADLHNTG